jgi:hypothetical protein
MENERNKVIFIEEFSIFRDYFSRVHSTFSGSSVVRGWDTLSHKSNVPKKGLDNVQR